MVTLTDGQKATLSPEAVKFLDNVRHVPFSNIISPFLTTPRRVAGIRQNVNAKMAEGEAALIERHIRLRTNRIESNFCRIRFDSN
jgi:hypothetical protein